MPRGVYDRSKAKSKKSDAGTQAPTAGTGAKAKRTWKSKSAVAARSSGVSGGTDFTNFTNLQSYLTTLSQARHTLGQAIPDLDIELKATLSNLRNMREILFSVDTEQVIAQSEQRAPAAPSTNAPVPFNPPAYAGVQQ